MDKEESDCNYSLKDESFTVKKQFEDLFSKLDEQGSTKNAWFKKHQRFLRRTVRNMTKMEGDINHEIEIAKGETNNLKEV